VPCSMAAFIVFHSSVDSRIFALVIKDSAVSPFARWFAPLVTFARFSIGFSSGGGCFNVRAGHDLDAARDSNQRVVGSPGPGLAFRMQPIAPLCVVFLSRLLAWLVNGTSIYRPELAACHYPSRSLAMDPTFPINLYLKNSSIFMSHLF
jgi:hypothetical protein